MLLDDLGAPRDEDGRKLSLASRISLLRVIPARPRDPKKLSRVREFAKQLAERYMQGENSTILKVYWVEHDSEARLIGVDDDIPDCYDGEVIVMKYPKGPDTPFKVRSTLISSSEWENRDELKWPPEMDPSKNNVRFLVGISDREDM